MSEKVTAVPKTETPSKPTSWDLRSWLANVEELGELKHVSGAHWDVELGGIAEINNRQRGPSLLFDDIVDYPSGYRVLTGTTGSSVRLAATLALPTNLSDAELVQLVRGKPQEWESLSSGFPPEYVDTGPILENVKSGDEVNLLEFPVPKWHELDGGRFIGTGCVVVTKDLDSNWINLGAYRMMVHDEKSCALNHGGGQAWASAAGSLLQRGQALSRGGLHWSLSAALSIRWPGGQLRDQRVQLCRRNPGRAGAGHQG